MSDSQGGVIKWIGGIATTIITGVVVWHLTEGTKLPERTPENSPSFSESGTIKPPAQEQPSQSPLKPLPPSDDSTQPVTPVTPSPSTQTVPSPVTERWKFMGVSTKTWEEIYVDNSSINKSSSTIYFTYKIGNDLITASADCDANRWDAKNKNTGEEYGWKSPQSPATQSMMNYVCKS